MKTCCFTGHRIFSNTEKLKQVFYKEIITLIENDVTEFYVGGAIGWDMFCGDVIIRLRKKYPNIHLNLVLPCVEADQIARWSYEQKKMYKKIVRSADSVEILSDSYYKGCMKKRNQRLVELADCCICYFDKNKSASGTGQTVRMAQKKKIIIINILEIIKDT